MSTTHETKTARLEMRLPADTRALIAEAAALTGTSQTDYVLNQVVPAARRDVVESRTISLSKHAWTEFLDIIDQSDSADLAALRAHEPAWGEPRA